MISGGVVVLALILVSIGVSYFILVVLEDSEIEKPAPATGFSLEQSDSRIVIRNTGNLPLLTEGLKVYLGNELLETTNKNIILSGSSYVINITELPPFEGKKNITIVFGGVSRSIEVQGRNTSSVVNPQPSPSPSSSSSPSGSSRPPSLPSPSPSSSSGGGGSSGSSPSPAPVPASPPTETVDIPLILGFNYIGIPVKMPEGTKASDIAVMIESQGGQINSILRWDEPTQKYISWLPSVPLQNDFEISAGKGYAVRLSKAPDGGVWRVTGESFKEPVPVTLVGASPDGKITLINIPYSGESFTALTLANVIEAQGGDVVSITVHENGGFFSWLADIPTQNNFEIKRHNGYLVKLTKAPAGAFIPSSSYAITPQEVTVEIPLSLGFNYVGFPVELAAGTKISDIATLISSQGGTVNSIQKWDPVSQGFVPWTPLTPSSNNFAIKAGEGYVIRLAKTPDGGVLIVKGEEFTSAVPVTLVGASPDGKITLINMPYGGESFTALTLADAIESQGGEVVSIAAYENGGFFSWFPDNPTQNNFEIKKHGAYQVKLFKAPNAVFVPSKTYSASVPSQLDVTVEISLVTGYNYVGIPVKMPDGTRTLDIDRMIRNSGGSVISIERWNSDTQEWQKWFPNDRTKNQFTIEDGRGYVIRVRQPSTWNITGEAFTGSVAHTYVSGFNLVSYPYTTESYTASTLADALESQGHNVISIQNWNPSSQTMVPWSPSAPGANNFAIENNKAYYVRLS